MELNRVVVVGGGMAGLAAAATLSARAREVVVVERREAPALPPQAGLPHAMLVSGALVLNELFPDLGQRLLDRGAAPGGPDPTRVACYWAAAGAVRRELRFPDLGITRTLCSRELIQQEVRASVEQIPNVRWEQDTVTGALARRGAVRGVALGSGRSVEADLVVDAGGRDGGVPLGADLPVPPTSEVGVDIRYTAFLVERRPEDLDGAVLAAVQNTPDNPRMAIALPMEGDRWQVGFGAYFGQTGPTDPDGARAYAAAALADPILAPLVGRPFLDRPWRYTFRTGRRRHWERLARPVPGYVAVGDSVASFNPIYGQGMSSALLQVRELGRLVDRHGAGRALATAAPKALATVVDAPWRISTGADFMYARTVGVRPRGQQRVNGYVARVLRAAAVDDRVNLAFTSVSHLLAPPAALFAPPVLARVLRHRSVPAAPAQQTVPARTPPAGTYPARS
ncbi:NAD(P)/FAD-dependent oxidoreductase [Pseudonocardia broussonetiae]|uniref:NAD(P)-binding protein n=1 Tax=Pseudonocardia broussonetiae TaxID=2736640 RepID=A0A6M6JIP1_9PSEU|nr:NAD(P)-binding protein [Pseudonocardia broussonetiae]QJY47888.1 NAD(P)-binding protein [Pseudonocardia broussonetiae]